MDKVTRQCPQTTTFLKRKESRSGTEPRLSRGLGDVYKRQIIIIATVSSVSSLMISRPYEYYGSSQTSLK